ncbi:MAG: hypothetical protein HFI66_08520 [Lachnospiraceae bacterium]|jgi:hypothetical protein|nr:hypothetical protein [Lachnospiraceae bacterium]
MKQRLLLAILLVTLLGIGQGCGGTREGREKSGDYSENGRDGTEMRGGETRGGETRGGETAPEENPADADLLLEGAGLIGSVTEFSGEGCSLLPVHEEGTDDGGGLAWSAAEGHEADAEKINVSYGPDCIFQIAKVDIITAKATYEPASLEDVKKQTDLVLYGSYGEDGSFLAEKVYVYRRMEG